MMNDGGRRSQHSKSCSSVEVLFQTDPKARALNASPPLLCDHDACSIDPQLFAGPYYDPMYGEILVTQIDDQLQISFSDAPLLNATLEHWHFDTYEIKWEEEHAWFDFGTVSFELDNNLEVEGIEFDVPNGDIFFHELHPKRID